MLWLRILSALIGIPILLLIIIQGDYWLALLVSALVVIGTFEFINMLKTKGFKIILGPVLLGQLILILGAWQNYPYWSELGIGLSFILILLVMLQNYPNIRSKT